MSWHDLIGPCQFCDKQNVPVKKMEGGSAGNAYVCRECAVKHLNESPPSEPP